jgi:LmbE family N-acetylglucosaminyl deacetylase
MRIWTLVTCFVTFLAIRAAAQHQLSGTAAIEQALQRLRTDARALMIAAHPDDENTALLAWLARGRHVKAGYLSLTRGEGGQNLIGSEQGAALGVIRTQELLAARRIDGAEQFFTRAIDFGYSKTAEETLAKWGRERVLGDIVAVVRRFRPHIIVLRFSGTARDGHGHHQSSAILGREAFDAAADSNRFAEQLTDLKPWRAKRILFNAFAFTPEQERESATLPGGIEAELGDFNPVLGFSYGEIAGMSRSMHRSQGFGAPQRRGTIRNYLVTIAGDPPVKDLFDGIDLTWAGTATVDKAISQFDRRRPDAVIPLLFELRDIAAASAPDRLTEIDETVALCAGLWLDASADRSSATRGSTVAVTTVAINRSQAAVELEAVEFAGRRKGGPLDYNGPVTQTFKWKVPEDAPYSQPYWMRGESDGLFYAVDAMGPERTWMVDFHLRLGGRTIVLRRPIIRRYVDSVRGELVRPFTIVPSASVRIRANAIIFASEASRAIPVDATGGKVVLTAPAGWRVDGLVVTPPRQESLGELRATAIAPDGTQVSTGIEVIDYPHIPPQTLLPPARAKLVRVDVQIAAKRIGYIMGAGDEIPDALRQLGCEVEMITPAMLAGTDLGRFDAIVAGVRAYNVRTDLRENHARLMQYVEQGGTYVVQYNVLDRATEALAIGPYPLKLGRGRVAVEEAPIILSDPRHPLLHKPNEIRDRDFEGWVQERGLYFVAEFDKRYQPLFSMHDPGEAPLIGSTLVARYGKGAYVYTSLSWFRQLPAGVPGAYRIFANLLSAGKTLANDR